YRTRACCSHIATSRRERAQRFPPALPRCDTQQLCRAFAAKRIGRDSQESAVDRLREDVDVIAVGAACIEPCLAAVNSAGDLLNRWMGVVAERLIGGAGAPEALTLAIRDNERINRPAMRHRNLAPVRSLIATAP